jgi:hypothetical protein
MAGRFSPLNSIPVASLLIAALLASGAFADPSPNERLINGKVVDALDRPVSGARVTLESLEGTLMDVSTASEIDDSSCT